MYVKAPLNVKTMKNVSISVQNIEGWNTRLFKDVDGASGKVTLRIKYASVKGSSPFSHLLWSFLPGFRSGRAEKGSVACMSSVFTSYLDSDPVSEIEKRRSSAEGLREDEFEGVKIVHESGDYAEAMGRCAGWLRKVHRVFQVFLMSKMLDIPGNTLKAALHMKLFGFYSANYSPLKKRNKM